MRWNLFVNAAAAVSMVFVLGTSGGPASATLDGADSLQQLQIGNARYVCGKADHPNVDADRRAETFRNGQKPFAIVLSCSDSRVPVEVLFDQGIGDVFTIRVAGNVVDKHEAGSIEYAVEHLHAGLLVVMGHRGCGAVAAAVSGVKLEGNVESIIADIKPAIDACKAQSPGLKDDALVSECIKANVFNSMAQVFRQSALVREAVKSGKLKVVGAVYDIESGSVNWLGTHAQESELIRGGGEPQGREAASADEHGQKDDEHNAPPKVKAVTPKKAEKKVAGERETSDAPKKDHD